MMGAVYPSLLSNLGLAKPGAKTTLRTGNRHGGLNIAPYNVYPTCDGSIAILSINEAHWVSLTTVLEHAEWREDARFSRPGARVKHMAELDAAIGQETARWSKAELCARLVSARVPCAPV